MGSRTRGLGPVWVLVAALSLAVAVLVPAGGTYAATTRTVSGKVTLPSGHSAAEYQGVYAHLYSADDASYDAEVQVESNGTYAFQGVPAGRYYVYFLVDEYLDRSSGQDRPAPNLVSMFFGATTLEEKASIVDIRAAANTKVNITLQEGRSISGKVSLPSGVSASAFTGVTVRAYAESGNEGWSWVGPDGSYRIDGLVAGSYRVGFDVGSSYDPSTDTERAKPNLVSVYYPGVTDASKAQMVDLSSRTSIGAVNVALKQGRMISGKVTLPSGSSSSDFRGVTVLAANSGLESSTGVNPDGTYQLVGLAAGSYIVQFDVTDYYDIARDREVGAPNFSPEYWPGASAVRNAERIDLTTATSRTGVNARLARGRTITGRMTVPAGAPANWFDTATVTAHTDDDQYDVVADVKPDGTYALRGLYPLAYSVRFSLNNPAANIADEWWNDKPQGGAATVVNLAAASSATGINAAMAAGSTLTVDLALASGVGAGSLALFDSAGETVVDAAVSGSGAVALKAIAPGTYRLGYSTTIGNGFQYLNVGGGAGTIAFPQASGSRIAATAASATGSITGELTTQEFVNHNTSPCAGCADVDYLAQPYLYQSINGRWVPLPRHQYDDLASTTNGKRAIEITGLAPGTYAMEFGASTRPFLANGAITRTYWKDTESLAQATPITVTAGSPVRGIVATVSPTLTGGQDFVDISTDTSSDYFTHFFDAIRWMGVSEISTGYTTRSGQQYRPTGSVTREAMAAFLYRAAGSPAIDPSQPSLFIDVDETNAFRDEIVWMSQQDISNGWQTEAGAEFRPKAEISREAMAAFLYRLRAPQDYTPPTSSPFVDITRSNTQFYDAITWMSNAGISTGTRQRDGSWAYKPRDVTRRDAMAAFLYRFYN